MSVPRHQVHGDPDAVTPTSPTRKLYRTALTGQGTILGDSALWCWPSSCRLTPCPTLPALVWPPCPFLRIVGPRARSVPPVFLFGPCPPFSATFMALLASFLVSLTLHRPSSDHSTCTCSGDQATHRRRAGFLCSSGVLGLAAGAMVSRGVERWCISAQPLPRPCRRSPSAHLLPQWSCRPLPTRPSGS